jgi:hypothetical protein
MERLRELAGGTPALGKNAAVVGDPGDRRLVDRMRARLEAGYWPRVHCMLLVSLSAAAAFLTSVVLMLLRIDSLAIRYGAAAVAGYLTFLGLLRTWVRWKWSRVSFDGSGLDPGDVIGNVDLPLPSLPRGGVNFAGGGGRSGGGGASGVWDSAVKSVTPVKSGGGGGKGGGWGLDLDGDDLFWVIVALAAAFSGAIAIGYVIWIAPTLLAEAIVNGAVAGKVYHGLQKRDHQFWTEQTFKRTIVSGVIVIVCAVVAGYACNRIAPEARSIGGVWAHLHAGHAGE